MNLFESAIGLTAPDHLLTVGVQSVVNDPSGSVDFLVVSNTQVAKPFGDGI